MQPFNGDHALKSYQKIAEGFSKLQQRSLNHENVEKREVRNIHKRILKLQKKISDWQLQNPLKGEETKKITRVSGYLDKLDKAVTKIRPIIYGVTLITGNEKKSSRFDLKLWTENSRLVARTLQTESKENISFKESLTKKITLPTIEPETIKTIDKFLVNKKLDLNQGNFIEVLEASRYLDMPSLRLECENFFMIGSIQSRNLIKKSFLKWRILFKKYLIFSTSQMNMG